MFSMLITRQILKTLRLIDFKLASSRAIAQNKRHLSVGENRYTLQYDEGQVTILDSAKKEYAEVSNIIVNPLDQSIIPACGF